MSWVKNKKLNAMKELNTTYRLCGKSRIFTLEKKKWGHSEVTGNAAGRRGPRRDVASGRPAGPRPPRARPASGTPLPPATQPDRDDTILFSIYYICRFLLFFRISIFYFLVDALRNSPVVLDPLRSVDRSCDRRFSILFWHAFDFGRVWLELYRNFDNYSFG